MKSSRDAVIVSYARTPVGSFGGKLADMPATELGSVAIKVALEKVKDSLSVNEVDSVIMGHVLTACGGQATARQASMGAGLPAHIPSYSVDKVCASGMKAIMLATSAILLQQEDVIVAGGMESMSRAPYYLEKLRVGKRMGHEQVTDALIKDGLWDVCYDEHMGSCTERVNTAMGITRQQMDDYALRTYQRAKDATAIGAFIEEIAPIDLGKGVLMTSDEQLERVRPDKFATLKPSFKPDGIITPANASPISDGAAALVLMSREAAEAKGIKALARVVASADAARDPAEFTIAPSLAIEKALKRVNLTVKDIGVWEMNEAFATVVLANQKLLGDDLNLDDVNVFGGALALGHPLGCSGARIVCTLITAMRKRQVRYGCAAICNGGGGASAIIVELE